MSFGELLIGLIIFQAVTVWVCYFILTHESGSQRYKHGRDYPYDQDLDW
jgi:uncharacterized membrane protein